MTLLFTIFLVAYLTTLVNIQPTRKQVLYWICFVLTLVIAIVLYIWPVVSGVIHR